MYVHAAFEGGAQVSRYITDVVDKVSKQSSARRVCLVSKEGVQAPKSPPLATPLGALVNQ